MEHYKHIKETTMMVQFNLLIENALSVGAGAIEFILCHAEVEIAFAEEKKVDEVCFLHYLTSEISMLAMSHELLF
jgi:hypothetical protein